MYFWIAKESLSYVFENIDYSENNIWIKLKLLPDSSFNPLKWHIFKYHFPKLPLITAQCWIYYNILTCLKRVNKLKCFNWISCWSKRVSFLPNYWKLDICGSFFMQRYLNCTVPVKTSNYSNLILIFLSVLKTLAISTIWTSLSDV